MSDERVFKLTYTNQIEGGLPAESINTLIPKKIALLGTPIFLTVPQSPTPNPSPHLTPSFHFYFRLTVLRHKREKFHAYVNLADVLSYDIWLLYITAFQLWCK